MGDYIALMEKAKACTHCGEEKPLSAFNKHSITPDGLDHQCRTCANARSKAFRSTPSGIYTSIKGRLNFYQKKPFTISREDFVEWFNSQPQKCVYCGITKDELPLIKDRIINASTRLTVDCVDNEKGYALGNLVLACMRCNYLKNDFLSSWEMLDIGPKYVRPKWDAQLNKPTAKKEGDE